MKKIRIYKNLLILTITLFAISCTTELDWDKQINNLVNGQAYVIPIGETSITLNDILNQFDSVEFIDSDENNIFVKYNDTVDWTFRKFDVLDGIGAIIDEYIPFNYVPNSQYITEYTFAPGQIITKNFPHTLDLGYNSNASLQRVDRAEINSAKIEFQVNVENAVISPSNITITAIFPPDFFVFDSDGSSEIIYHPNVLNAIDYHPIESFKIYSANSLQRVNMNFRLDIKADSNNPVIIYPNTKISIRYKLYDVNAKAYYGFFSPTIAFGSQEQTIDISEFVNLVPKTGIFKLAEPSISMDVFNNSGIRLKFKVDSIKAFKSYDNSFKPVYAKFEDGNFFKVTYIDRKMVYNANPAKTSFVLNHEPANGAISRFFDNFPLPDRLYYRFWLTHFPQLGDPLDFITPDASIKAAIGIKVPLKLNAGSQFQLHDTLKNVNLDSVLSDVLIEKAQLVLRITNGLPLKGRLSLSFINAQNQIIDGLKLLADSTIKAPEIDDNGIVLTNSKTVSNIVFMIDKTQIPKLKLTKKIAYSFLVESAEGRKITLQKENSLKLNLGIYLKGDQILKFE